MNQPAFDATRAPWTLGLVGAIAGGVAGVVGIVLLAVSPSDSDSTSGDATTAWIAPGPGGIQIAGTW